jgi:hypothetical protein
MNQNGSSIELENVLLKIKDNLVAFGITLYPPATTDDLKAFEADLGFALPEDFKTLYSFCNGFESAEDMFRITPLEEVREFGRSPNLTGFYFAEYMTYCDRWDVAIDDGNSSQYTIWNRGMSIRLLSRSLAEFLDRFLTGGVFEKDGLYDWHEEIDRGSAK